VKIDPAAVDPADVEMLEDLVLAALHDVSGQLAELQDASMGSMGDLLGGGMGGGLGGLFGGGAGGAIPSTAEEQD